MKTEKLILVTNDDGYDAPGIEALIEVARKFGRVIAVAPRTHQSGKSQAITSFEPLYEQIIYKKENVELRSLTGTPVDCVKFAIDQLLREEKIDLVLSGINHGSNASINVLYSGTMGAAINGSMYAAPSIGFSHLSHNQSTDLTAAKYYVEKIIAKALDGGLNVGECLNVNIPDAPLNEIKGIKITRQCKGYWRELFTPRTDPNGREYYWLSGYYVNSEEQAQDTDIANLHQNYITIVPTQTDLTAYAQIPKMTELFEEECDI